MFIQCFKTLKADPVVMSIIELFTALQQERRNYSSICGYRSRL